MKKIGIILASLFLLLIIGISMIPLFYKVDDLRPEIQKQIEAQVRGKVTLGELSLSTFPSLKVNIGASVFKAPAPYSSSDFVEFQEASVSIPLNALLFSPHLSLSLKTPKIVLISKGKDSNYQRFSPLLR